MKKRVHPKRSNLFKYILFSKKNIFTYIWGCIKLLFNRGAILHANGTHIITGYMGSGKTLLANKIINDVDKSKYFFISNIAEFNDVKTIDLNEVFNDNKQVKSIPTRDTYGRKLYAIIFDEINLNFNKRLNRTSEYNDIFIGLIEFLVTSRHQDIPRIYFIGQKLELQDTQLQSLFKYNHDIIKCRKRPRYWYYKENKGRNVVKIPVKSFVMHKVKSDSDEFIEVGKAKYKIKKEYLNTYDTTFLGKSYKMLDKANLK